MAFRFPKLQRNKGGSLEELVASLTGEGQPNLNALTQRLARLDALSLTVKFFGYELARALSDALPPVGDVPVQDIDIACKPSTQADISSDWVAHWCRELHMGRVFHRKVWELAYVLQAIYRHGSMRPGARGLGFGCGQEVIPSYLAARGVTVTVTDQPPEAMEREGWSKTGQHTETLESCFHPHLVSREDFDAHVSLRYVDMNAIDPTLGDYDFCWSVCAFEHLGSIEKGLAFVENALQTVRPGGLAVHTTEFNIANAGPTIDNWPTVLFQRRHFTELAERLRAKGHDVAPLDFDVGHQPLDKFIDIPPYQTSWDEDIRKAWEGDGTPHLKVAVDGFVSTCFGLIVRRGGQG
jgi:2-polyprenyl-3-methyl-5-hydroxy-6-metoxy-1,4-benzoquinol methylase